MRGTGFASIAWRRCRLLRRGRYYGTLGLALYARSPRPPKAPPAARSQRGLRRVVSMATTAAPVTATAVEVIPAAWAITVLPALGAAAGVALEQEPVRVHDAVDALNVDRRAALFAAMAPDQRVHPAIAVG